MPRKTRAQRKAELIEQHRHRIGSAVGAFLRQNPEFVYLRDDLESEGFVRLVDSVDRFVKGKVNSLPAYLRLSIWSGLWEAARTDDVIQSPRNCSARQMRDRDLSLYFGKDDAPVKADVKRLLRKACVDKTDRLIIAMLQTGKTVRSIASELELGINKVRARKKAIGERVEAEL